MDRPASVEQIQLVAVLRILGGSQDEVASELRIGKMKVEAIEYWIKAESLRHVEAIFDDQPLKRVVGRELPSYEEVEPSVLVRAGQVTGDDILRHYRDDYLGQQQAPAEQPPYAETPHRQKMRELAKALAERISLSYHLDSEVLYDMRVDFRPGKYSLSLGLVEIDETDGDKQIKVTCHDVAAGIAEPYLVKGLYSHLVTSGLPRLAELVGDKGKLTYWVCEVGQYSQALLKFLKLIADEAKEYKTKVYNVDEAKPGLTEWFIMMAWNDALQRAHGRTWIDDSWYKLPESIPGTNLWTLKCGSYGIGIARSKRTLAKYEKWHKKLRADHDNDPMAKDIVAKAQALNSVAQDIRQRFQEFSDMEHIPGHCDLDG